MLPTVTLGLREYWLGASGCGMGVAHHSNG